MWATKVVLERATILSFWKGSQAEHCRATQSLEPSRPRWIGGSEPTIHGDKIVDYVLQTKEAQYFLSISSVSVSITEKRIFLEYFLSVSVSVHTLSSDEVSECSFSKSTYSPHNVLFLIVWIQRQVTVISCKQSDKQWRCQRERESKGERERERNVEGGR